MRIVILSDIHANVTAFKAVLADIPIVGKVDAYAIIGDLVNYGPRPNEIIEMTKSLDKPLLANLWGNHEYSIFGGSPERFATDRGRAVLQYTYSILTPESHDYLDKEMEHSGFQKCQIDRKSFLFMHGNLDDPYWGKFGIDKMNDERFTEFDYVISGHSHVPHYVEHFFASDDATYRNPTVIRNGLSSSTQALWGSLAITIHTPSMASWMLRVATMNIVACGMM